MAKIMGNFWTNFIKHGSPGQSWQQYKNYWRYILNVNLPGYTNDNGSGCCNCQFWTDNYYSTKKPESFAQNVMARIKKTLDRYKSKPKK
jgi:hypothetical protein